MFYKIPGILIIFAAVAFGGYSWWQSGSEAAVTVKVPAKSGLVGYWSFEEATGTKAIDLSGNGNIGTLTNMANPATATSGWGTGKLGGALNFDGVDDYVSVASINNSGTNVLSVSFWLYQSSFTSTDLLAIEATTNTNNFTTGLMIDPNSGAPCSGLFQINVLGGGGDNASCWARPSAGAWHHYVVIGDKGQAVNETNLYIDGVLQTPTSRPFTFDNGENFGNDPWYFMSRGGSSLFNSGKLDEVRIYNRALSAAEVIALYQSGSAKIKTSRTTKINTSQNSKSTSGLVGMWSFNGPDVTDKVYDRSGQGNNGYFIGGATSSAKTIGKIGQALSFSGTSQYMSPQSAPSIDPTGSFTYSVWVKLRAYTNGGVGDSGGTYIFDRTLPTQGLVSLKASGDRYLYQIRDDNGTWLTTFFTADNITLNQWTHLVVVRDFNKNLYLYRNGVQSASAGDSNSSLTPPRPSFGGSVANNSGWMDGSLDEVRIYNRALSASEVAQLYNMGR